MIYAYLSLFAGCAVFGILSDATIKGAKAWAIVVLACGLWSGYFILAMLEWLRALTAYLEAQRAKPFTDLFNRPEPERARYMLKVDAARYAVADVDPKDLEALAAGLLAGRPFSEREWSRKLRNFRAIQDEFERRGLVRTVGKRRILNGRGRRAMLEVHYGRAEKLPPSLLNGFKSHASSN